MVGAILGDLSPISNTNQACLDDLSINAGDVWGRTGRNASAEF